MGENCSKIVVMCSIANLSLKQSPLVTSIIDQPLAMSAFTHNGHEPSRSIAEVCLLSEAMQVEPHHAETSAEEAALRPEKPSN